MARVDVTSYNGNSTDFLRDLSHSMQYDSIFERTSDHLILRTSIDYFGIVFTGYDFTYASGIPFTGDVFSVRITQFDGGFNQVPLASYQITFSLTDFGSLYAAFKTNDATYFLERFGSLQYYGSESKDVFSGSALADYIYGDAGADTLYGGDGNDTIEGWTGNDVLYGEDGNDTLNGSIGSDSLYGGAGNDSLSGSSDSDVLHGEAGNDILSGGTENDYLFGEDGDDAGYGGDGSDTVIGGAGADFLRGEAGDDRIDGQADNDTLFGDEGADTVYGGDGDDTLYGWLGADLMSGGNGDDVIRGEQDNDNLNGEIGDDTIYGGDGDDVISGGVGADVLAGDAGADAVSGDDGADALSGGAGNDTLRGGSGDDLLFGLDDDDTLYGDAGRDTLIGGYGNDSYFLLDVSNAGTSAEYDTVTELDGVDTILVQRASDGIHLRTSYTLGTGVENGIVLGTSAFSLTGNELANSLTGNEVGNTLSGLDGADTLDGRGGDDTLFGGNDIDTLSGGAGNDTLDGGAGGDLLNGGTGDDTFYVESNSDRVRDNAGEGFDTVLVSRFDFTLFTTAEIEVLRTTNDAGTSDIDLTGNSFAQTLIGNAGDNRLDGKAGADVLRGLDGDDVLIGGTASAGASNQLFGDNGSDTASYSGVAGAVYADLRPGGAGYIGGVLTDILHSIENLTGGSGADVLVGDEGSNVLGGGGGSDQLYGFGGNDILLGGAAGAGTYNILFGGDGSDTASYQGTVTALYVELRSPAGYLNVGGSYVLVDVMDSVENAIGGSGNDLLVGTEGANLLDGGAGTDNLYGFGGDDILVGGSAAASQYNVLVGGAGTDTASYAGTTAAVYADLSISAGYVQAGGSLVLTDILLEMEGLAGGSGADTLLGDGGANRIAGGAGADVLYGRGGADTFAFATVADSRISTGADTIVDFQTGFDKVDLSALGIGFGQVLLANASSSMALYADTDTTAAGYEFVVSFVGANAISISDIVF